MKESELLKSFIVPRDELEKHKTDPQSSYDEDLN